MEILAGTLVNSNTAVGSACAITLIPLILTWLFPIARIPQSFLQLLLSFAVGSLLGDLFLHLLPQHLSYTFSLSLKSGHLASRISGGNLVLYGFLLFLVIDRLLHSGHSDHDHHHHNHSVNKKHGKKNLPILTAIASITHTITDGIQLGIVHSSGNAALAWSTTLAIFSHEIPHKLSEYAIMVNSGYSFISCIIMQLLMSIGTFIGMFGVLYFKQDMMFDDSLIMLVGAGGLLYTATLGIIPSISSSSSLFQFSFNIAAILLALHFSQSHSHNH